MSEKDVSEGRAMEDFCPMDDSEVTGMNEVRADVSDVDATDAIEWTESDALNARIRLMQMIKLPEFYSGAAGKALVDYIRMTNIWDVPEKVIKADLTGRVFLVEVERPGYDA